MESTFKLSALGIQPGHDPQAVRAQLRPMMKNDAATFDDIFHRISSDQAVVLGENVPKKQAEKLQEKLTAIGLKCRLDSMTLSLVPVEEEQQQQNAVHRCPACGHTQPPARGGNPDICERCGVVGQNYATANEFKQALEMERNRVKAALDKEKKAKLDKIRDKADQQKEKAQQELLERARRQAEKELRFGPWQKLRALLKPHVLYPTLGSLAAGFIGVGLLIWQLGESTRNPVARPNPPPSLQTLAAAASANPAAASAAIAAITNATNAGAGTATPGEPSQTDHTAAGAPPAAATAAAATAPTQTGSLLDADQLTLNRPAAGPTSGPAVYNPQVLASLARYQMQIGDLAAAARSIDRASEWQSAERGNLSSAQLDTFNRILANIHAEMARQHHQRRDLASAETYWLRATALAHSIKTPTNEHARALSRLARAADDTQASTAEDYFRQAIAALPRVTESSNQALTLGAIARDLAQTDRAVQSQALFERAEAAVKALQNPEELWVARTILAKHYAEAGDAVMTKTLLAQIASDREHQAPLDPNMRLVEAHSALALTLVNSGDTATARTEFAAALEQTQRLTDPVLRAEKLLYLARDMAAAGDLEAAAKLAAAAGTGD